MKTRDQKMAGPIYTQVSSLPKDEHQKYGSMAHKLPILIRTAGLVQALTFSDAKGHHTLLNHLAEIVLDSSKNKEALLAKSRNASLDEYMQLTQQTLAALLWYKRFAQSVLGVEQGSDTDQRAGS